MRTCFLFFFGIRPPHRLDAESHALTFFFGVVGGGWVSSGRLDAELCDLRLGGGGRGGGGGYCP